MSEVKPQFRARLVDKGLDIVVAQAFGDSFDAVEREGLHYMRVYAQDGPVELQVSEKRNGRWRLMGGLLAASWGPPPPVASEGE